MRECAEGRQAWAWPREETAAGLEEEVGRYLQDCRWRLGGPYPAIWWYQETAVAAGVGARLACRIEPKGLCRGSWRLR